MNKDLIVPNTGDIILNQEDNLSRTVGKALQQIEAILDTPHSTTVNNETFINTKILSIKKDAAAAIINAGLKADENRFRRENKDIIERLFDKIKKESKIVDGEIIRRR